MYKLGYLSIDTEIGGPNFFIGKNPILEVGMLPFPDPRETGLQVEEFIARYVVPENVHQYVIKPYAPVDQMILTEVLHKTEEYYQRAGEDVDTVAQKIHTVLHGLKRDYMRVTPTSDWQGDVTALEYLISRRGTTTAEILGTHNMLHIKSLVGGQFGDMGRFSAHKRELGVVTEPNHTASRDCIVIAETAVRSLMRQEERKRDRVGR